MRWARYWAPAALVAFLVTFGALQGVLAHTVTVEMYGVRLFIATMVISAGMSLVATVVQVYRRQNLLAEFHPQHGVPARPDAVERP